MIKFVSCHNSINKYIFQEAVNEQNTCLDLPMRYPVIVMKVPLMVWSLIIGNHQGKSTTKSRKQIHVTMQNDIDGE